MKRLLLFLFAAVLATAAVEAQIVESSPSPLRQDSKDVVITFHADRGNAGLKGLTSGVYAHTGVVTNKSNGGWAYAPTWGDNSAKYALRYVATDTWELTIGDIRSYYGITDAEEKVERLAFVFRSADKSKEGKTETGGDIFIDIEGAVVVPDAVQEDYPGGKPVMGAVRAQNGDVTFCLAAPDKKSVEIAGSWNGFEKTPLKYQDYEGYRYFWTTVSGLSASTDYTYFYIVDGTKRVADPYAHLILDPANDSYIASVYPDMPQYPAGVSGLVLSVYRSDLDDFDWTVNNFQTPEAKDLIIYEMLFRDFTGTNGQAKGEGTVLQAIERLPYLKKLGVNAVELMPIMEFSGNNSWGYNPNFYMAPDKAYGSPADYKTFIDRCHQLGMAVILDVVFNQADGGHPWYQMYDSGANPFFNAQAPHDYSVFNDWRQEHPIVRQHWKDVVDYWMGVYRVDGFRFDLVKGLGDSDSYGSGTEAYNASRVANMKRLHGYITANNPRGIHINENLAGAREESEMAEDGQLCWSNQNGVSSDYAAGKNQGLNWFSASACSRPWGSTVSYMESHDEERVAFSQNQNGLSNELKYSWAQRGPRLASTAAQMILTPGPHMIWQFQELGADESTKRSGTNNTDPKKVVWNYLDNEHRAAVSNNYSELIWLRRSNPELFSETASSSLLTTTADWNNGRFIQLTAGGKEILLMVNTSYDSPKTLSRPVTNIAAGNYRVISYSHGFQSAPDVRFSGNNVSVTVPANNYVVLASASVSGVESVVSDDVKVRVVGGSIVVDGEYSSLKVYTTSGVCVPAEGLAPGLYIVQVDGKTVKIRI